MRHVLPALCASLGCAPPPADPAPVDPVPALDPVALRVATFNASMSRDDEGQLLEVLQGTADPQPERVADVVAVVAPDVLLINEFDRDPVAAALFAERLGFAHHWLPETNTGLASGLDLDGDGQAVTEPGSGDYADDAHGFGTFPGQFGMLVVSRFPLQPEAARSFQTMRWADLPDSLLDGAGYAADAAAAVRLSSKNHVDLPVDVDGHVLHLLISHPTPPSFDGPEDRNGRRNHDEIRLWTDYLDGAAYLVDDAGNPGGLADGAPFVLLGDLNSDPVDGDSRRDALLDLLAHPRVVDPEPVGDGGAGASQDDGQANASHAGDPALDTADFSDGVVGNLRVDYALPADVLQIDGAGVFWPADDPGLSAASDHHLVWVDIVLADRP